ncbi:MAG: type II secretion system protein GspK [Planctomycetota bacterium]|jgi:hypothetical protein
MTKNNLSKIKKQNLKATGGTNRRAVALVLTLVVLVVLTTIVYALSSRISQIKHRRQYLIDYQMSRYACDSALKFAIVAIKGMDFKLIERKDKPDFSDVFTMDRVEYELYLDEWAQKLAEQEALGETDENIYDKNDTEQNSSTNQGASPDVSGMSATKLLGQLLNSPNSIGDPNFSLGQYNEPNEIFIPGPYGPEWPHVRDPVRLEIGKTKIVIEFADENAKMPLTWAIANDTGVRNFALDALEVFGAWMQMDLIETMKLAEELEDVEDIKRFTINPKPISITQPAKKQPRNTNSRRRNNSKGTAPKRTRTTKKTLPATVHITDFAKLLHGSAIDLEALARPLPDTGDRNESPLKYMGLWGSQRVNINTAPRHVLEAAFTFGGDAEDIAEEIIQRRHEKPFASIDELQSSLYRYSGSIKKAKNYITTASKFFAIKVTANHGRARTSAVATVIKERNKIQPIAVISDL